MSCSQENLFNIPHSLPSSAHSIAVTSRPPTAVNIIQDSKFLPDYGGNLEIPGTRTKQYGLRQGIPFDTNPFYVRAVSSSDENKLYKFESSDNLIVTSYLNGYREDESQACFSVLRALGSNVYFNSVQRVPNDPPKVITTHTYAHIPYSYNITGLKFCDSENYLLVKFDKGVKLLHLNKSYRLSRLINPSKNSEDGESDATDIADLEQSALRFVGSYPSRYGYLVKDACMSTNQRILATASSDRKDININLYDIERSAKSYRTIVKSRDDNAQLSLKSAYDGIKKKTLRSYVPVKSSYEELQQVESDPGHLIHMVITTSNRVAALDIRSESIQKSYVDRFKLLSTSPVEIFRQVAFSRRNDQQFYLLTNERISAFDKRFLSQPMNSLKHGLRAVDHAMLSMKLINSDIEKIETACLSSLGRLCFVSFDQACKFQSVLDHSGQLVNPISLHSPLHEPSPIEITGRQSDELYGLDVATDFIFSSSDIAFAVVQLSQEGDICIRGYENSRERLRPIRNLSQASVVLEQHKSHKFMETNRRCNPDLTDREDQSSTRAQNGEEECLPYILDESLVAKAEERLTSNRAVQKYQAMKRKLRK